VTDDDVEHEPHRDPTPSDGPGIRDLLSLGGMLVGCIVVGVAIGLFVDARLGYSPAGVLVGTVLGIAAASAGFWIRVRVYLTGR
jgi:F0F1-type ATP synthase assembly protein I